MSGAADLSGRWSGIFNYPRLLPPTSFEADLRDHGGAISGVTTEPDLEPGCEGQTLHATIEGVREGDTLRFTKIYDDLKHAAEPVQYHGLIQPGGDEIDGTWEIAGVWSGTFLMVRSAGSTEEVAKAVSEEVD